MANGFKALVRAPIKGCHILKTEDIFEKMILPATMMIEADSSQGLIQAIGYLKYNLSQEHYDVVMRGQRKLYDNLKPSLFRNAHSLAEYNNAEEKFKERLLEAQTEFKKIASISCMKKADGSLIPMQGNMYDFIDVKKTYFPPLLQHYGINTPWLDVVDNIWVALWFSCWECEKRFSIPEVNNVYPDELNREVARFSMYHERRVECGQFTFSSEIEKMNKEIHHYEKEKIHLLIKEGIPEGERLNKINKIQEKIFQKTKEIDRLQKISSFCYIILLKVPQDSQNNQDKKIQVVDLRKCIPSYYLRPHAQHALVIRKPPEKEQDFTSNIAGIIRIKLENALQWLGMGQTLSVKNLFPSPCCDYGLRKLLGLKTFNQEIEIPTP